MIPSLAARSPRAGRRSFAAAALEALSRLVLASLLLGGCGAKTTHRTQRVPVLVAQAERRTVPFEIEATGTVEPMQSAAITAQVGGLVTRVAFREGDEVRAGQPLFQLDARLLRAAVAQAEAVWARDRAQAQTARLELERGAALAARQLIAAGDLDQRRSNFEALAASARADSAALVTARLNLAYATVRAPIGGKTGNLFVHVGDLVKADDTANPLVTINQIRPIRVRFTLPQANLSDVRGRLGRNVRVDAATAEDDSVWIQGRLAFVDNGVDPGSGTVLLKGEFPNRSGELWPGQFVRVRLRLFDQGDATVVPATAVTSSQSGTYLFVVKADTTVEARPITVSRTWGDYAVISAGGVRPGETVVTDGQLRLSPGAKAQIRSPAAGKGDGGKT